MLSLDVCKRLKAAGFPQKYGGRWWFLITGNDDYRCFDFIKSVGRYTVDDSDCACPNSDELIAEIMKIRDGRDINIGSWNSHRRQWFTDIITFDEYGNREAEESAEGDSPAAALAELYLAIKAAGLEKLRARIEEAK